MSDWLVAPSEIPNKYKFCLTRTVITGVNIIPSNARYHLKFKKKFHTKECILQVVFIFLYILIQDMASFWIYSCSTCRRNPRVTY